MRTQEQRDKYNAARRTKYHADPEKGRAVSREWRKANLARSLAAGRAYRLANAEKCRAKDRARYLANPRKYIDSSAARRKAEPERHRTMAGERKLVKLGIDPAKLPSKPRTCPECGRTGKIVLDHCHASLRFRGWLCHSCNVILGLAHDNPETLRKLADYLERHKPCS